LSEADLEVAPPARPHARLAREVVDRAGTIDDGADVGLVDIPFDELERVPIERRREILSLAIRAVIRREGIDADDVVTLVD
jgi:hypothetical protein